jgi:cell division protein FtsW
MLTPHFPLQRKIIGLVLLFLSIGQIALFSATGVLGLHRHQSEFYFVLRQAACAVIGLSLMIMVSRVPYQKLRKLAYLLMAVETILIAFTLFSPFGHEAQGATRWLRIGPLGFQPSEFAKVAVTIYVAHVLALNHQKPLTAKQWAGHGVPIAVLLALILKQLDLGTTTLLTLTVLGMCFISGMRLLYLGGFLVAGTGFFVFSMLHYEYRRRRLMAFLNPWSDPQGTGFQSIQSYLSFHSGHLFGTGIGNGNSKLFFLPDVHTDFIYALIGEETGFIGAIAVLLLFLYFTYLLFRVSFASKEPFACYLSFGLSLSLILQVAVNMGGVTGILPVKGLPLPFISWGRSALIVNLASLGIILNILRQSVIIPRSAEKPVSS